VSSVLLIKSDSELYSIRTREF